MPGHNHSFVMNLEPGDLATREASFLWNCPITDEGLSIRQHLSKLHEPTRIWYVRLADGGRTLIIDTLQNNP